jgi:hypothetical protein
VTAPQKLPRRAGFSQHPYVPGPNIAGKASCYLYMYSLALDSSTRVLQQALLVEKCLQLVCMLVFMCVGAGPVALLHCSTTTPM